MNLKRAVKKYTNSQKEIKRYKEDIKLLMGKIEWRETNHHWLKTLVPALAKDICKVLGYNKWEVLGPFGLPGETTLWFWNFPEEKKALKVDSLTFYHDLDSEDNPFRLRFQDLKNPHKRLVPPADADITWFVKQMQFQRGNKKKAMAKLEELAA